MTFMNILHIIPKLPINKNYTTIGGSANSLINLYIQQKKQGEKVDIISYFPMLNKNDNYFLSMNRFKNINIKSDTNSILYGAEFIIRAALSEIKNKQKHDVIHGHSGHIDYLLASILTSRIKKCPLVYSLYCPLILNSQVTKYPFRKKYLEIVVKDVTFIAISKNIEQSLKQISCDKKIRNIPPPINIEKFSNTYSKKMLRSKHFFETDQPVILFVGNFTKTKNMECVLLAFKQFLSHYPTARLIITTELSMKKFSERESYIKDLISELSISENLNFMGIIDNMPEVMQIADVLVAPFRDTDGPSDYYLAALESMAVGTPVFVSPVGGMKEVINDLNGRFIDPEQPEQLLGELLNFFSNHSMGYEMGLNASRYIRNNFAPELIERKIKDVYLEVLEREN